MAMKPFCNACFCFTCFCVRFFIEDGKHYCTQQYQKENIQSQLLAGNAPAKKMVMLSSPPPPFSRRPISLLPASAPTTAEQARIPPSLTSTFLRFQCLNADTEPVQENQQRDRCPQLLDRGFQKGYLARVLEGNRRLLRTGRLRNPQIHQAALCPV